MNLARLITAEYEITSGHTVNFVVKGIKMSSINFQLKQYKIIGKVNPRKEEKSTA